MRLKGDPVPNQFPTCSPVGEARIAIVGECPGRDEDYQGQPFVGESGRILSSALEHIGLTRSQMLVANVCQAFPGEERDFNSFAWEGEAVQAGVAQLKLDLAAFNPTMVLCLGNAALHLFKHGNVAPPKRGGKFDWPSKVGDWRGSLFASRFLLQRDECACPEECGQTRTSGSLLKCLAAYHPAAVAREQGLQAYYRCAAGVGDLERLKAEAGRRELVLPKRDIRVLLPDDGVQAVIVHLRTWKYAGTPISVDIEGHPGNVTSIAFALKPDVGTVVPLAYLDGTSVWSEADEVAIWQAVKELLEDEALTIIGQNFSYDAFALAWTYGITPRGRVWDTMELHWELWPELDKGLDVQASLYTLEPFYKPDKHREDGHTKLVFGSDEEFWNYNGRDSCVTLECKLKAVELLTKRAGNQRALAGSVYEANNSSTCLSHAAFNSALFAPAKLYPMLRGIRVDMDRVEEEKAKAALGVWELQARVDEAANSADWQCLKHCLECAKVEAFNASLTKLAEPAFAPLCLAQLGGKNPRQRVEVVEERWQPMKWVQKLKGKEPGLGKWVKDGKLVTATRAQLDNAHAGDSCWFLGWVHGEHAPDPAYANARDLGWLKPMPRTLSRLQAFTPTTLDEVEPHLLKEGQAVWKRVKQIWKELKHKQRTGTGNKDDLPNDGAGRPAGQRNSKGPDTLSGAERLLLRTDVSPAVAEDEQEKELKEADYERHMVDHRHRIVAGGTTPYPATLDAAGGAAALGELSTLLGLAVNIGSTGEGGDAQWFLYEVCGLPKVWKNERTGRYSRESESEWKRRTKEGVKHVNRQTNRLADRAVTAGNSETSICDSRGTGSTSGDEGCLEQGHGGGAQKDDYKGLNHGRRNKGTSSSTTDTVGGIDRRAGNYDQATEQAGGETRSAGAKVRASKRLSTDQQALDKLYAATQDVRVLWCLQQRRLRMVVSDLSKEFDDDYERRRTSNSSIRHNAGLGRPDSQSRTNSGGRDTNSGGGDSVVADEERLYKDSLLCLEQQIAKSAESPEEAPRRSGRVRSSISLVKETGRMAASKSPLGTGTNLMALNKDLLRICVADEGCEMGKFDLEGADSWTVAAECAALGDETMLLDLRAGLKPAKVLCLLYAFGEEVNMWHRDRIKVRLKQDEVDFQPWLYPAAKSTIHGYCYGSGWETTRDTILKYSMADLPLDLGEARPIVLSKAQVEKLRGAAASRYPGIKLWHAAEGKAMLDKGWIDMSTGHRRLFFGRKAEWKQGRQVACHDTLKEWLASKPQYYTTLVIKMALKKLWEDPENRRQVPSGWETGKLITTPSLRIEPLMARHDELLVQWRLEDREWALAAMKGWLHSELEIAGQRIVIPAEGKVGLDWSMAEAKTP